MVRRAVLFGAVLGAGLLLAAPGGAQPQDNSSQAQQKQSEKSESQKKDQKKSTAQANPFPQAKSEAAERQAQQGNAPAAPAPQTAPNGKPSTADRNPFPEAESERAAHQDQENQNPQNQDQQRSGEGKSGFSSSQVKGLDLPTQGGAQNTPAAKPRYNPQLAKQDNKVGTFYLQSGDWRGAYDRFLEASQVDPGSAEAVYGLGESAAHLGKRDEALRNFQLYLSALPDGPHAKDIRKELKKMSAEPPK